MKKQQRRSIEIIQIFKAKSIIEKAFVSVKTFTNIDFVNFLFDERRFELLSNEFESKQFKSSITSNFTMTHLIYAENLVKNFVNLIKILKKKLKTTTFDDFIIIIRNSARKKNLRHSKNSSNVEITILNQY